MSDQLESLLAVYDNASYNCDGDCASNLRSAHRIANIGCAFCEHIDPTLSEAIWDLLQKTREFTLPPYLDKSGKEIPGVIADAYTAETPANALAGILESCASAGHAYKADYDFWYYVAKIAENYTPTPDFRA